MVKALSVDLRTRVLAAVAGGATHREAAERFGVSAASVSRWRSLLRERGDAQPGALGGDRRSGRIEAQADLILRLLDEMRDATIEELRAVLCEHGHVFGYGTLRRFFQRHRITRKKVGQIDRRSIAALAGLAPIARDSGRRSDPRSIGGGRPIVRTILYLAALQASRRAPEFIHFREHLQAAGKSVKAAIIATARKLVVTLNAMLASGTDYRPAAVV